MESDFFVKGELGRGAFGVVYLVEKKDTRELLALKAVDLASADDKERTKAKEEASLLSRLDHEHVVTYITSYVGGSTLFIITEFCEGGDLGNYLEKKADGPLPEDLIVCWLAQLSRGLAYMHSNNVLHRDLKPVNVYLTGDGNIKLGDLGIARVLEKSDAMAQTMAGTPCYMSPEMFQHRPYNQKSDIWSLGCVAYEMASFKRAFGDGPPVLLFLMMKIISGKVPTIPDWYSSNLKNLVKIMMSKDPEDRPDALTVLEREPVKQFLQTGKTPRDIILETRSSPVTQGGIKTKGASYCPFGPRDIKIPKDSLQLYRARQKRQGRDSTTVISIRPDSEPETSSPESESGSTSRTMRGYESLLASKHKGKNKAAKKAMPDLRKKEGPDLAALPPLQQIVTAISSMAMSDDGAAEETPETVQETPVQTQKRAQEQQYLLRQIQLLQKICAEGIGQESLHAAYSVMDNVSNPQELKEQLVSLLGQELFEKFGHKIMYLRLFELGLQKLTR